MKITSISAPSFRGDDAKINNDSFGKKQKKEKKYVDPLANWPMRGLGYTNDIGVAINEIAPKTATLFWVPALMYFGADVYDKYKNKGNKYDPNAQRAFSQAVFQSFASIILPTVFGHIGQSAFSQIDKYKGEKISTNAKEQTLRFIKHHVADNSIIGNVDDKGNAIESFERAFDNFYTGKKNTYGKKNIFAKAYDKLLANCKYGAIANSDEQRIKEFAKKEFSKVLDTCKNSDALNKNLDNRIFKLKAWKSLGSFTALLLTVKPIDTFVDKVIIKQVVEPQMSRFNHNHKNIDEFGKN